MKKRKKSSNKKQLKKSNNYLLLLLFIAICLGAGFLGSSVTIDAIPVWYAGLKKPLLNPPNYIFAPVWTALYLFMAVAAWQVYSLRKKVSPALVLFIAQLVCNVVWSFLFFGKNLLFAAFIEILILWLLILVTMLSFFKVKKSAGWLMVPYLLWVSFASYLNLAIWLLNK